jgi:hypothetical protein
MFEGLARCLMTSLARGTFMSAGAMSHPKERSVANNMKRMATTAGGAWSMCSFKEAGAEVFER